MFSNILGDILTNALGQLIGELTGETLETRQSRHALHRAVTAAISRAEQRFAATHYAVDAELVDALTLSTRFADLPSVVAALREVVANPFRDPAPQVAVLRGAFAEVLPAHIEPARLDAALRAFLQNLGQEVMIIPQLQRLYALRFQQQAAAQLDDVKTELRHIRAATAPALPPITEPALLIAPAAPPLRHNLPHPDYARFVGRAADLAWITAQLDAPTGSAVLVLVGIGGMGKSALALAAGHAERARDPRRFDAIVWVSAKETALTADGPAPAAPAGLIFHTLADIASAIAQVLDRPEILRAMPAERARLLDQALAAQPTLLIIDNFETVADAQVLAFLRALPSTTCALLTSRIRQGIGVARELDRLDADAARALLASEAAAHGVTLSDAEQRDLAERAGGLPLPIKLSLARLADGASIAAVRRWLDDASGELPAYCVQGQVELAQRGDAAAWQLLLAAALFEQRAGADPAALAEIAGLDADACDTGLARLKKLALINRSRDGRVWMLPIMQRYALAGIDRDPAGAAIVERWLGWATRFAHEHGRTLDMQIERAAVAFAEYPALRLAIDWCAQRARHAELLALVEGSWFIAELLGRFDELTIIVQAALDAALVTNDIRSQAFAHRQLAWIQRICGAPLEVTVRELARAGELAELAGDTAMRADIWYIASDLAYQQGDLAGAAIAAQLMLDQAAADGDLRVRAMAAYRMAKVALRQTGAEAALGWLDAADTAAQALGWRRQVAWVRYRRGVTEVAARRFAAAEAALEQSLAEAQAWGEERLIAYALQRLVEVYAATGRHELAWRTAVDVRTRFERLGIDRHEFGALIARLSADERAD